MRVDGLAGGTLQFESDEQNRITKVRDGSGHSILYKYAANGRLSAIYDSTIGDEHYEYDQANRLTVVRDARGNAELSISYGYSGEITQETLADGRTLRFKYGFDATRELNSVVLMDDHGFETKWTSGQEGYYQSLPKHTFSIESP